ncbi:hypothetical protein OsI_07979 [Oryza sativa Indica Group]|uniref:Ubiquitin-like protease family profile domain-containing protein n=1 Tax=Oryza sativa subsp. indica TaxID=39946 RepID=B8AF21_ORYSI|nr:hypothetical protein OsI_07979 [Oryza sativa Indica Group]
MERYRRLRSMGTEVFFKCSVSKETTLMVMEMLEKLDLETDECETKNSDLSLCGHVLAQSLRTDIESHDKVHDPMEIVPKGAPTKRLRGFMEKRVRRCGYCRGHGHTNSHQAFKITCIPDIGTAEAPHIIESDDDSLFEKNMVDTIGARLRRPHGRVSKPTHRSDSPFLYYKKTFASALKRSKEPKTTELSLQDEITINYMKQCDDDEKLLSSIDGIQLTYEFLRPLVNPKDSQIISKWLKGSIFLPLNRNSTHRYVAVLNGAKEKIQILDSMRMDKSYYDKDKDLNNTIKGIEKFIQYARLEDGVENKWKNTKITNWPFCPMKVPQQSDSWSCGLHTLKFIQHWNGKELSPEFNEMDTTTTFKHKVAANLINSTMNKVIEVQQDIKRLVTEANVGN